MAEVEIITVNGNDHTVRELEVAEVSDNQVAYRIQCCEDPAHISNHTFELGISANDVATALLAQKQLAAERHQAKLDWRAAHPNAVPAVRS